MIKRNERDWRDMPVLSREDQHGMDDDDYLAWRKANSTGSLAPCCDSDQEGKAIEAQWYLLHLDSELWGMEELTEEEVSRRMARSMATIRDLWWAREEKLSSPPRSSATPAHQG